MLYRSSRRVGAFWFARALRNAQRKVGMLWLGWVGLGCGRFGVPSEDVCIIRRFPLRKRFWVHKDT